MLRTMNDYWLDRYSQRAYIFEDKEGRLLTEEEIAHLDPWEIEDREIHVWAI